MKKLFLIALIFITACSTPQPQVTVTAPPTVTAALTSTPQPTSTPVPPPTLTFTPTAVTYSAEQLESMTDDAKIEAAREMVGDAFGDKTIAGESVEGSEATFFSTYRTTDEWGNSVNRNFTAGGVNLKTGEVVPGYSPMELVALYAEGNMPETFFFNREKVHLVEDTESPLARAQEATYQGVDYPAEITYWQNEEGEIVLVDWPAWPGGPRGLVTCAMSEDGRLIQLLPVDLEVKLTLENLSAKEREAIFSRLTRDHRNQDLVTAINDPNGVVISVGLLKSTTPSYWGGDENESPRTAMSYWKKYENESTSDTMVWSHTADYRNPGIVVAFTIIPDRLVKNWKMMLTYKNGEYQTSDLASSLAVANQTTASRGDFDRLYYGPYMDITKALMKYGVRLEMFDAGK
ncbi:MAG: hypothetical protein KJZ77_09285 [Anaerolineales bacterium]|nr:hypothetical protein [Anaerolineales bacterium]